MQLAQQKDENNKISEELKAYKDTIGSIDEYQSQKLLNGQ